MTVAESVQEFLENKVTQVKGIFCHNNYYRNNYNFKEPNPKEETTSPNHPAKYLKSLGVKISFPLSDLLSTAASHNPNLRNPLHFPHLTARLTNEQRQLKIQYK